MDRVGRKVAQLKGIRCFASLATPGTNVEKVQEMTKEKSAIMTKRRTVRAETGHECLHKSTQMKGRGKVGKC